MTLYKASFGRINVASAFTQQLL